MAWTATRPTEYGLYWYCSWCDLPCVVVVEQRPFGGEFEAWHPQWGEPVLVAQLHGRWMGPVVPPVMPETWD